MVARSGTSGFSSILEVPLRVTATYAYRFQLHITFHYFGHCFHGIDSFCGEIDSPQSPEH